MKQLKNQRGLTLVELLAVIVILAIIAAIAAVAIGNVINNSKDKAILSDAVTIIDGAKIAVMDDAIPSAAKGSQTITYKGEDKNLLKAYIELSEDKWEAFKELEIKQNDKDEVTYNLTFTDFTKIKNKKYKPNGDNEKADLNQILKALDGKGNAKATPPAGS